MGTARRPARWLAARWRAGAPTGGSFAASGPRRGRRSRHGEGPFPGTGGGPAAGPFPGTGGGPALASPVAVPRNGPALSWVRTWTVASGASKQESTVALFCTATCRATAHGSPEVIPRAASAAARAARSAAAAALDAAAADWARSSSKVAAMMTTSPSPKARTVPEPRSRGREGYGSRGGRTFRGDVPGRRALIGEVMCPAVGSRRCHPTVPVAPRQGLPNAPKHWRSGSME